MPQPFDVTNHCFKYPSKYGRFGYTTIEVLEFLTGRKWDEISYGFVHAIRPSKVVVNYEFTDSCLWRVHVKTDENGVIVKIIQEVEVRLPQALANSQALVAALEE